MNAHFSQQTGLEASRRTKPFGIFVVRYEPLENPAFRSWFDHHRFQECERIARLQCLDLLLAFNRHNLFIAHDKFPAHASASATMKSLKSLNCGAGLRILTERP